MSTGLTEETWWEVTLSTGLILTLPAPLLTIEKGKDSDGLVVLDPADAMYDKTVIHSASAITGQTYGLKLDDVVHIQTFTKTRATPDRLTRSAMRASGHSLPTSSPSGPTPGSLSGHPESPSGRSTGARIKRPIRH